jgi:hypothetical protein
VLVCVGIGVWERGHGTRGGCEEVGRPLLQALPSYKCAWNPSHLTHPHPQAFVNKVAVMHGELPVVKRLSADMEEMSAAMLEQLLQRLQANIQLPECLRIIGYLRRLATFPGVWVREGAQHGAACTQSKPMH